MPTFSGGLALVGDGVEFPLVQWLQVSDSVKLRLQPFSLWVLVGIAWVEFRVGEHWHNNDVQIFLLTS